MTNHFVKPINEYKQTYNFEEEATYDLAFILARSRGLDLDEALDITKQYIHGPEAKFPLRYPNVSYLERGENGDRELKQERLDKYLNRMIDEGLIIAPNLTCYIPPHIEKSVMAEYIVENMNLRKIDKGKMFLYRMRQDHISEAYFKTLQESRKIKNNSVSGMHASSSTPGHNKSSHSSLTSGCRCATSYANAGNEKFIGGLRHYYNPNTVLFHITVSARHSNLGAYERAHAKWGIHYPTPEEAMEVVRYSTQYYWTNDEWQMKIYQLLKGLTPVERAAFVYSGDWYHFDKYNGELVKHMFAEMGQMVTGSCPEAKEVIKGLDDNYTAISSLLCVDLIKGIPLVDAAEKKPEAHQAVALTALHLKACMEKYKDIIHGVIRQEYLPLSIAAFPTSMRKSVPTSDTDSTIFTVQYWAKKYGEDNRQKQDFVHYIMTFFIAGMTEHTLKMYSANLGVAKENIGTIKMKNEYIFPTYVLTALAKHYFAYISAGEGNVYEKYKTEIKGVNLRSSNAPPEVNEEAHGLMRKIMDMRIANQPIYLKDVLDPIVRNETKVISDILSGKANYMNSMQVKPLESYTQGENAPAWKGHEFWNEVFADKYGVAPTPPYRAYKINVNLPNKKAIADWLATIKDDNIRQKLEHWVISEGKTSIALFRMPKPNIGEHGIPEEIRSIVDLRGIVISVMKPFYYVLEAMGFFMMNKHNTRLVSDEYVDSKLITAAVNGNFKPIPDLLTDDIEVIEDSELIREEL